MHLQLYNESMKWPLRVVCRMILSEFPLQSLAISTLSITSLTLPTECIEGETVFIYKYVMHWLLNRSKTKEETCKWIALTSDCLNIQWETPALLIGRH